MAADLGRPATDERCDLAVFLASLSPDDWARPSLCTEWSVRDVVAHILSYDELGIAGLAGAFVRGRFSPERINIQRLAVYVEHRPEQLLTLLGSHLEPRGFTSWFGGGMLSDCVIHHQDIRRALNRPRSIPAERLRPVLDIALKAPVLPAIDLLFRDVDGSNAVSDRFPAAGCPDSSGFHDMRGTIVLMSLRLRALVTVIMMMVGALAWTSAASASSSHRVVTRSECEAAHCDAPAPDSCRAVCQHAPRLLPATNLLTARVPSLRSVEFGVTLSVASDLNLSERLDRPPR